MGEQQPDPDEALVAAWRACSITMEAVEGLAQRVFDWMCAKDARLGFGGDGQELAADVVRHAVRKLDSFRGDALFFTWVIGIARNILRNYYCSRKQDSPAYLEELPTEAARLKAPDAEMREILGRDAIDEARRLELTDHEREIFKLRWDEQLDIKEIATRLGMTEKAASGAWMRAARKVHAYLKKHGLL